MVSRCCKESLHVHTNEDCSYYVCSKCNIPSDPITWNHEHDLPQDFVDDLKDAKNDVPEIFKISLS